jgi:hypothetical protein
MGRYILILIIAISSPLLHAQSRGQRKSVCAARDFSTLLQQSTNDEIPKTTADILILLTQIYTGYMILTDNLEA